MAHSFSKHDYNHLQFARAAVVYLSIVALTINSSASLRSGLFLNVKDGPGSQVWVLTKPSNF